MLVSLHSPAMTHSVAGGVPAAVELPWGTTPDGEFDRQGITAGFVMGTLAVVFTLPLGIIGIVLSCMGLDRVKTNPGAARKFMIWSWSLFVAGTILGALVLIWGIASQLS